MNDTTQQAPVPQKLLYHTLWFLPLLFFYGLYPEGSSLYPGAVLLKPTNLPLKDVILNPHAGYPTGMILAEGLPLFFLTALSETIFGGTQYFNFQLTQILFLLGGFVGISGLLRAANIHYLVWGPISFLYLLSPFCFGHYLAYPHLAASFILLPLILYSDLLLFRAKSLLGVLFWGGVVIIAHTIQMFESGYGFVFLNFAAGLLIFFKLISERRSTFLEIASLFFFCLANLVAVSLYKVYIPESSKFGKMSLDFFRGQGVDIITLLLPFAKYWWTSIFNLTIKWTPSEFAGDGSNVAFNYLGYFTLLPIAYYIIFQRDKSYLSNAFIAIALSSFILSLGPSLKFNSKKVVTEDKLSVSSYTLTPDEAVLELPTKVAYKLPGISYMRAVYRWLTVTTLGLLVLLGFLYHNLIKRGLYVPFYLLVALNALEKLPDIPELAKKQSRNFQQAQNYLNEVIEPLERHLTEPEKVLFLSSENDYLVGSYANLYPSFIYNVGGDKARAIVKQSYPKEIREILEKPGNLDERLKKAFSSKELDALVIPYYSLRQNYLWWPPQEKQRIKVKSEKLGRVSSGSDEFKITEEKWFSIVRPVRSSK